jgi:hypothetical protein
VDKNLARRNMRWGLSMFIFLLMALGAAFAWAAVFLTAVK